MANHEDFNGHCEACSEPVLNDTGPGISYTQEGIQHAYHRHCFKCEQCQTPIKDTSFFMHETKPHCQKCYEDHVLGQCGKCGKGLAGTPITKAGDRKFHPSCFTCSKCNNELQTRYFEKDGQWFCRGCYENQFVPDCSGCGQKILPDAESSKISMVQWQDKTYHQKCFACRDCNQPFNDLKALHHKKELYCQECYFKVIKAMDDAAQTVQTETADR
ncbi:hypothetical protein HKX48_005096 [Thoreauomyces humboldtii]|nr:hypothetical protein HKX48_005096 [Thoreauomyces humboldtii]